VFSRAQLLDRVWGSDLEIELRTVDATIRRLRRALNACGEADLLRTVRAEGYSLDHKFAMVTAGLAATAKQGETSAAARVGDPGGAAAESRQEEDGRTEGRGMAEAIVPDELWAVVAPLLPSKLQSPEGGRPPLDDRAALAGILFVLKAGIGWSMLPKELGCGNGMTCQRRLREWQKSGVWKKIQEVLARRAGWADSINWERIDAADAAARLGSASTQA
jgi:transposase